MFLLYSRIGVRIGLAMLAAAGLYTQDAAAQDYPSRPITLVVPFPGGGSTDLIPRVIQDGLGATLGQPIVIENRPGASGTLGSLSVSRAQPDGYTLLFGLNPPISMNMYLQKNFPYDPLTAFEPVSLVASTLLLLVVHPSLPAKSVRELVDYAKANPSKLSYGSAGIGTGHHILGELLKKRAGIEMVHVPYRGTGPMIQDLVSGQFMVGFSTPTAVVPLAEVGRLRLLGLAEKKRYADMPDLPTIDETVPGMDFFTFYAIFAPAGTPRPIVDKLNAAIVKELKDPRVVAKLKEQAIIPMSTTPEGLTEVVKADLAKWKVDLPLIGLEPQ